MNIYGLHGDNVNENFGRIWLSSLDTRHQGTVFYKDLLGYLQSDSTNLWLRSTPATATVILTPYPLDYFRSNKITN